MKFLLDNRLISAHQHGFVPKKCCTTNLLEAQDLITGAMNTGSWVDVLFIDFAKAFDKVSHEKLILKLKSYGFGD